MKKSLSLFAIIIIFTGLLIGTYSFWNEMRNGSQSSYTVDVQSENSVVVDTPESGSVISSPVSVSGKARGAWFFEASFPVEVIDANGSSLGMGIAQAKGDWMTEDYVPFNASVSFTKPVTEKGFVLFKKDNPSGLPENDATIAIPIIFAQ